MAHYECALHIENKSIYSCPDSSVGDTIQTMNSGNTDWLTLHEQAQRHWNTFQTNSHPSTEQEMSENATIPSKTMTLCHNCYRWYYHWFFTCKCLWSYFVLCHPAPSTLTDWNHSKYTLPQAMRAILSPLPTQHSCFRYQNFTPNWTEKS